MRKILLASAAMVGAAGLAQAQPTAMPMAPTQGMTATQSAGNPPAGVNTSNNGAAKATPGAVANPLPGTVVIHFNGRILVGALAGWSSTDKFTSAAGSFKVSPVGITSYMRLYTGIDGLTTNGLRYGAGVELRQNFGTPASSTAGTNASAFSSQNTVFVRRSFGYVANDNVGILRFGITDGVIGLYDAGVTSFQFLPSGNLNGGDLNATAGTTSASVPASPIFGNAGNEYDNAKLLYLSPQFAGFDFGFQWAPSTTNHFSQAGNCTVASSACPELTASTLPIDGARIINQTVVGVRYQGSLGPLGVLAFGAYEFGGHVKYNGAFIPQPTSFAAAGALTAGGTGRYENPSFGYIGTAISFAGVTFGGNVVFGDVNGQGGLKPTGGATQVAWLAGAKYTAGPLTVGAVGEIVDSQGDPRLVGLSQRHEAAISTGVGYTVAPGMIAWAEYVYQQRHQGGFSFATGAPGATFNDVRSQGVQLGTTIFW
jgi:hypothetical protein